MGYKKSEIKEPKDFVATYRKLDDNEYMALIKGANELYRELRGIEKYRSILSAASLDQYISKGGVGKLLATYAGNVNLLTLTDKIKDSHFINAVGGLLLKERPGLEAGIRLKALNEVFTVIKANVHVFDRVLSGYFEEAAHKYFYANDGYFVKISEEERREFCSAKIHIYPESQIWSCLFEALPDTGRVFTTEGIALARQSIRMQADAVIQVLPNVLGRFIDAFLTSFQQHLVDEGFQDEVDLADWLWDEYILEGAVSAGLHAIEFYK